MHIISWVRKLCFLYFRNTRGYFDNSIETQKTTSLLINNIDLLCLKVWGYNFSTLCHGSSPLKSKSLGPTRNSKPIFQYHGKLSAVVPQPREEFLDISASAGRSTCLARKRGHVIHECSCHTLPGD